MKGAKFGCKVLACTVDLFRIFKLLTVAVAAVNLHAREGRFSGSSSSSASSCTSNSRKKKKKEEE